ncbi:MAG: sialidase family protein [Planctomycetota bacterium]
MRFLPAATVALVVGSGALAQIPAHATALNPTTSMRPPLLVHDGDDVHAFGLSYATIRHARSRDGGRTWPVREVPLGNYGADPSGGAIDVAAAGPGILLVLANDQGIGPVHWRSVDHGTTWSPATPLFNSPYSTQGVGQVALLADGLDVVATWLRSSSGDMWCRRSVDGGATWLPQQVLDVATSFTSGNSLSGHRNGSIIDLLWNRNGSGTVHQRSIDGGATWLAAPSVVAPGGMPGGYTNTAASDGTNLLVLVAVSGGTTSLRSANGGASWSPLVVPGMTFPRFAQEGPLVVAVGGVSTPLTYVVSVSTDSGLTWSANPLQLPSPVNLSTEVAVAAGVAYVRFYPGDLLGLVVTRDAGLSWQLVGGPVNGGFAPGERRNVHLLLQGFPGTPTAQYLAYTGLGSTVLGAATPGTGGLAPGLVADGLPFQGSTTTLRVENALPGSVGALALSFAAPFAVPLGSATVWPTVGPIVLAFATGGTVGQPGSGGYSLPIAVPVNAALVGASFTSQALVIDAANPDGFAVTNALETWLR